MNAVHVQYCPALFQSYQGIHHSQERSSSHWDPRTVLPPCPGTIMSRELSLNSQSFQFLSVSLLRRMPSLIFRLINYSFTEAWKIWFLFQSPRILYPYSYMHVDLSTMYVTDSYIFLTLILAFSHSQVGCTLDYWDEDCGIFSVLEEFRLSETTPTEVIVSRLVGSRKWRIAVVEVEWEDDEEGERFVSRLATTLFSFITYRVSLQCCFSLHYLTLLLILQTYSAIV